MDCSSRLRWIGVAAVGLIAPGCVYYLPHCAPKFRHIPAIRAPQTCDELHVFRVDGSRVSNFNGGCCARYESNETFRLTRLHPSANGRIGPQWGLSIDHGHKIFVFFGGSESSTEATLGIALYRPGFETIRMSADDEPGELTWKPVADIVGYEHAVDDLLGYRAEKFVNPNIKTSPAPGGTSPEHHEALLFCAGEYERIAATILEHEPDREVTHARLIRKAKRLRELAEKKPERSS